VILPRVVGNALMLLVSNVAGVVVMAVWLSPILIVTTADCALRVDEVLSRPGSYN